MLSQASTSTSTSASASALLDRKIEECTADLTASVNKQLLSIGKDNAATIVKYTEVMRTEVNTSNHYRRDLILLLCRFSKYLSDRPFKEISRENIVNFLDSLRKTETKDPMHKWIGTYNLFLIHLTRFFKWLYSPDLEPDKRPKPSVFENIPKLKRKETSIYKPSDLWTQKDDLLFLKSIHDFVQNVEWFLVTTPMRKH
jgi:hypothetical protein